MRKLSFILLGLLTLVLVGCGNQNASGDVNTISVTGQAQGEVSPDVAYLSLFISSENEDSEKAKKEVDDITTVTYGELEKLGITEENIETTDYNTHEIRNPHYFPGFDEEQKELPEPIVGYRVSNTVKVTIEDLDSVGKVIDAVSGKSNISVHNLNFDLKDKNKAKEEVIESAIENAKEQSETIAKSLGVEVVGVHKVEVRDSVSTFRGMAMSAEAGVDSAMPISPENVDLNVVVDVSFIIK